MTLSTLLLYVGIAGLVLTLLVVFVFKKHKSYLMSYLQNFVGALFLFSGWVKAVDPLGTAYKMTDYFAEFEATFQGTWFSFLAPLFPLLNNYVVGFSVFMIIFEIVLGLMLIFGHKPKFTSWAFLIMILFFTFLTGFTYLTAYVPEGVNFFSFGQWGPFKESNMKVTDCGCFGDFIKLPPKTSFLKDVFLLIPGFYFLFRHKDMHELLSRNARNIGLSVVIVGLLIYCFSNYVWDIPHVDFRPFKKGKNLYEAKNIEDEAMANVQITAYGVENKQTGESKVIPYAQYLKEFQNYPETEWNLEQIKSKPAIAKTKLSDFDISDLDGYSLNDEILNNDKPVLFIVAYKLYGDGVPATKIVKDTIYRMDTLSSETGRGGITVTRNIDRIDEKTINYTDYAWKDFYTERYEKAIMPMVEAAQKDGVEVIMAIGQSSVDQVEDFRDDLGLNVKYGLADDILLKTIVRSNPGVLLLDKGLLLNKWHYKKLPSYEVIKEQYLKR